MATPLCLAVVGPSTGLPVASLGTQEGAAMRSTLPPQALQPEN